jgi:putative oxidoreductase
VQRLVSGLALLYFVVTQYKSFSSFALIPQIIGAGAALLLMLGLWSPIAGAVIALLETWTAFSHVGNPWIPILLAALGASLAMIGPGAWSLDARLFGRKHIET